MGRPLRDPKKPQGKASRRVGAQKLPGSESLRKDRDTFGRQGLKTGHLGLGERQSAIPGPV
jgi:hypothetical protein